MRDRERLARTLEAVRRESDCVLVDTAGDDLVLAAGCSELVLVMRPHVEGVLDSYRLLKRLAPMMAGRSRAGSGESCQAGGPIDAVFW